MAGEPSHYHLVMTPFRAIVCAVDGSELSRRGLYHAAGLAGATGAALTLVQVSDQRQRSARAAELLERFFASLPYGAEYLAEPTVLLKHGDVVSGILAAAAEQSADLIVCASHARSGLSRLLLGSTSAALLARTSIPMLLVPPGDLDLVTLGVDHVSLHLGAVLAAVDLSDAAHPQLAVASRMAALARQDLLLLNVARAGDGDDHSIAAALRAAAHGLTPVPPHALIVRRGEVAEEIARGAVAERAGLVVMGVRRAGDGRGRPGAIAAAVLQTGRAHVLAVPSQ